MGCCLQSTVIQAKQIVRIPQQATQPKQVKESRLRPEKPQIPIKNTTQAALQVLQLLRQRRAEFDNATKQNKRVSEQLAALAKKKAQLLNSIQQLKLNQKAIQSANIQKGSRIGELNKALIATKNQLEIEMGVELESAEKPAEPPKSNLEQQLSKISTSLEYQIGQRKKQIENEERQKQNMRQRMNELTLKIQAQNQKAVQITTNVAKLKAEQQNISDQLMNLQNQLEKGSSELLQIKSKREENRTYKEKVLVEVREIRQQAALLQSQQQTNPKTSPLPSNNAFLSCFAGDVLQGEKGYKQFLVQVLENRIRGKIKATKLVYAFDSLNKSNFHKYIDNKVQIVVLVKLINGYIVGAWSEGSFQPKMVSEKDGLIFSLTNRKIFEPLERNRRAVAYDDYFLIFGNSELRLKSQETKVFSNFAISNGYYNCRGEKVNILLGSGTAREVEMQAMEVFQLVLA